MDRFIAIKPMRFDKDYAVGEEIPESVINPNKLRRFIDGGEIARVPVSDFAIGETPEENLKLFEDILGIETAEAPVEERIAVIQAEIDKVREVAAPAASGSNAGGQMSLPALKRAGRDALVSIADRRGVDISGAKNNTERATLIFADIEAKKAAADGQNDTAMLQTGSIFLDVNDKLIVPFLREVVDGLTAETAQAIATALADNLDDLIVVTAIEEDDRGCELHEIECENIIPAEVENGGSDGLVNTEGNSSDDSDKAQENENKSEETPAEPQPDENGEYTCEICGKKGIKTLNGLKSHMKTHDK